MSSPNGPRIALVAGDPSLVYLVERYTEWSGLSIDVLTDPPPAKALSARPALVWFPSFESLARWRSDTRPAPGSDPAIVVSTTVPDEGRARELGADYCVLLPLTYDDFRAAVTAVGLPIRTAEPTVGREE
jgi:DNA-binding response OmpR family regulator